MKRPNESPVLVMDALGIASKVASANEFELISLADKLDDQYHNFKLRLPNSIVIDTKKNIFGSQEFSSLRMNDMFIVFSQKQLPDFRLRYMVSAAILYQQLLTLGFIPRGALGNGLVLQRNDMILGNGFIDAYMSAEKRGRHFKDICAVQLSYNFFKAVDNTEHSYRLLCWYEGRFFLNPIALKDPDIGDFDRDKVMDCLISSGANSQKLRATEKFLENYEDYDQAMKPESKSRELTGWSP
ncbi:hypothetical protein HXX02_12095 [Microbulbifer elongatus]|uniref:Uncharacterized protein n=1 Tax=Microbulbifer elongatus TaxID=86173 RepID=A0ABT1P241_9GAMM|nr:hypothetical protein [Microbulbifer elongatus]MCQ3830187.1 hypothetical protein [Microbulbifer elongatus]